MATIGAACGNPVAVEDIPDVAGSWTYSEAVTHTSGFTCSRVGTLSFEQEAETLVGTYARSTTCSGASESSSASPGTDAGTIRRGQAVVNVVEFELGDCQYRGEATDDVLSRLSGSVLCASPTSATDVASGSWVAERLTDINP